MFYFVFFVVKSNIEISKARSFEKHYELQQFNSWKQNRLSKDKEALKNSVLNVIRKKPAAKAIEEAKQGVSGGQTPLI